MIFLWMVIQILIESLPISSSGHVELLQMILAKFGCESHQGNVEIIDFLLHIPALMIMLVYFFTTWWRMVVGSDFDLKLLTRASTYQSMIRPIMFLLVVDSITAFFWYIKIAEFDPFPYKIIRGFIITAIMLYLTKNIQNNGGSKNIAWSLFDAYIFGLAQAYALLPGISRFATTFFAGRMLRYSLRDSFALSFLIQVPLVLAASVKAIVTLGNYPAVVAEIFDFWMVSGIVGMTVVSYQIMCFIGQMVERNRLWYFGYYMVVPIVMAIVLAVM